MDGYLEHYCSYFTGRGRIGIDTTFRHRDDVLNTSQLGLVGLRPG